MGVDESRDIRELVREYYGETLQGSDDLKTDACCCTAHTPPKYVIDVMNEIDDEIMAHFYGCGSPIPPALEGATVLDLGCGTGRDVYICSKLVGPSGRVIGVDMTEQQLAFARRHEAAQMARFGFTRSNVEFHCGFIEDLGALGIEDESVDVVVSNCVINLSPFKDQVFKEIARVLKPGGELYFSDIFSDRRVPPKFYDDPVLRGECLSGALYIEDFRRILAEHGMPVFYDVETEPLHVGDFQIETKLGCIGFASHTVRAIKCADLEDREENYGQTATYLGTMPENGRYFDLTEDLRLIKGRPVAVSGNMAAMLRASRYAPHFEVRGDRTLDITGGSPEMNPHLEWFVREASALADEVIVRSNLTILDAPEYRHFMQVYAECGVHLVTSLPYFNEQGCDLQRGRNVFDRVVGVLRELNELGYGVDPALKIDVAYNVSGPFLPPDQRELEEFYAWELEREQHVRFDNLYAFNNYALGRFANQLKREGKFDYYLDLLSENYNGAVVARMMCRSQVNVDYDGRLYDCEVNHVLGLPLDGPRNVRDLVDEPLGPRTIATSPLCYSCAAGCGSSCGGSLMDKYGE